MKMFTEKLEQTFFLPTVPLKLSMLNRGDKRLQYVCVCVQEKFWPSKFPALFSKHETTCTSMSSKSGQNSLYAN